MSDINITVNDEIVNIDVLDTPVIVEVTNSPGPAGVGVPVGGTTGQVLAKTSATNYATAWVNPSGGGVPYSGATGNVNLGEYELKAGQLTLDTSPTGTAAVGTTRWNDTTGTSETTLKGGSVVLKNGVDLVARVVNKVSPNTTLTKAAYQAVRVSGAQGQRLAVALAQANNDANSADTIGLVTETIPTNQEGFIITVGQLENINTTGSLQGETWVDGDVLYLSPFTAGAITNIKPTGNGHIVVIGYVEYAHANNGKIYVKVMNGWELEELHDVDIVSPANNEALIYESSTSLWKNKTIATALGFTPVPTTRTITINGVTFDLSADRTYTIAAGISGSGASGQVTYWTGASSVSGSNNLFWDNTNGRLGIGTNAPISRIETFNNSLYVAGAFSMYSNTTSDESLFYFRRGRGTLASPLIVSTGDVIGSIRFAVQKSTTINDVNTNAKIESVVEANGADLRFHTNNSGIANAISEKLRIYGNGNVVLQNGGTFTDAGQRLQVYGDTLLRGSGSTISTTALTVQNSSSTNLLRVLNDGDVSFGADAFYWDAVTSRLGIGTNAPLNDITINKSFDGPVRLRIDNTSTGTSALTDIYIRNSTGGATFQVTGTGNTNPAIIPNQARFRTDIGVSNGFTFLTGGTAPITFGTNDIVGMTMFGSTRNVGIGFTSDPAVRLGVSGDTLLRGSGATSATTALTVQNSSSTNLFTVRNDGLATFGGKITANGSSTSQSGLDVGTLRFQFAATNNAFIAENSFYNGTAFQRVNTGFSSVFYLFNGGFFVGTMPSGSSGTTQATLNQRMYLTNEGSLAISDTISGGGNITLVASAVLQTDSTTKGFLPPRMTTTQKNAIATPAAGLVVYDTTLNKLCVYTTAWETITSV